MSNSDLPLSKKEAAIHPEHIPGGMLELFKNITKRLDSYAETVPFDDYARMCSFVSQSFDLSIEDARTAITNVMNELGLKNGPSSQEEEWDGQKRTAPFGMQDPGFLAQPLSQKEVKLLKVAELKIADCLACKMNEEGVNVIKRFISGPENVTEQTTEEILDDWSEGIAEEPEEAHPALSAEFVAHMKSHIGELDVLRKSAYNKLNLIKTARTFNEGEKVLVLREDNKNSTKGHVLKVNKDATYDVMSFSGEVYQNIDPSKLHEPSAEGGRIGGENYGYFDSPRILSDHDVINDNPSAYADAKGQEGQTISDVPNPSLNE